jgi:hypothetical protein
MRVRTVSNLIFAISLSFLLASIFADDDETEQTRLRLAEKGFSKSDVNDLVAMAKRRSGSSGIDLSEFAGTMGLVIIESDPSGADIRIDYHEPDCYSRTTSRCWLQAGEHPITLTKQGYHTENASLDVHPMQRSVFHVVLKPVQ